MSFLPGRDGLQDEALLLGRRDARAGPRAERHGLDGLTRSGRHCAQGARQPHRHPDSVTALARELSDHILSSPTAVEALDIWCKKKGLPPGRITYARRERDDVRFPDERALDALRLRPHEGVETRCVSLMRGDLVVSEVDNWIVLNRLPPHVRIALKASNVALDSALRSLGASRRIVFVRFAGPASDSSAAILEHRAVFAGDDGHPLAIVTERYHAALLPGAS